MTYANDEKILTTQKGENKSKIKQLISVNLCKLGIPTNILGYSYLQQAILFVIEEPKLQFHWTKLYQKVALVFNITCKKVAQTIHRAVKHVYPHKNTYAYALFGNMINPKITSSNFIATLYEEITIESMAKQVNNEYVLIVHELRKLGIPASFSGYFFLRQSLLLILEEPELLRHVTTILYKKVAEQFNSTPSRVARDIRHVISYVFDNTKPDIINSYFGYTINPNTGVATNLHFLATIYDEIILHHMRENGNGPYIKVSDILRKLGIPAHINAYHYLRQALLYIIREPHYNFNISKLYQKIASDYNSTPTQVARSIAYGFNMASFDELNIIIPTGTTGNSSLIKTLYLTMK